MLPRSHAHASDLQLDAVMPDELTDCVTEDQLRSAYAHALRTYGGNGPPASPLHLSISDVGRSPDQPAEMLLELVASSAGRELGRRTLPVQARDCAALPNALAVVLAFLAHAAPASPAPVRAQAERSSKFSVSLSAGALLFFGVLQQPALGLLLRAATTGAPWSVRMAASALWPEELRVAEGVLRWQSYELAAEACLGGPLPSLTALALRVCAGPRVGWMFADSREFLLHNERASRALIYVGVATEAALRLGGNTWLQLGAGVAAALLRPRFVVGLEAGLDEHTLDKPSLFRAELALSVAQIF